MRRLCSRMVVFLVQRIDRYSYFCVSWYLVMLLYQTLHTLNFTWFEVRQVKFKLCRVWYSSIMRHQVNTKSRCPFFDLRIRWAESSKFGPKCDDLGRRILKADLSRGGVVRCWPKTCPKSDDFGHRILKADLSRRILRYRTA